MAEVSDQIEAVTAALRLVLGDAVLAVYLHGSGAGGRLQAQSDLDFLAIVDRDVTNSQRRALLAKLLGLSGRHPALPGGLRPVELTIFHQSALPDNPYPQAAFVYGEWLRDDFAAGAVPEPVDDPDHVLILAQARQGAVALSGPDPRGLLPAFPHHRIRQATRDALPALLGGLHGDERNVLLTLARMWHTASTGRFSAKDAAATWAMPRLNADDATLLDHARRAYLGEVPDDWQGRKAEVQHLAKVLQDHIATALN